MLTLADQTLWLLTTLVEAYVVCLFLIQKLFRKFLFLNLYLLLTIFVSIARYAVLHGFGYRSQEYGYFFYYSDALLTLSLFICVCELSQRVIGARMPCRKLVFWSVGAFLATTWFSFAIASPAGYRMAASYLLFEFTKNIYVACCLAVVLLGVWKLRNDSEDRVAARLVNVLAVYFSLFVLVYSADQIAPHASSSLSNLYPMMGAWLPLGCGFALVSQQKQ
jgi:glucan phosphoethanolaminetransferase (alkaline phosphatase superfamily)